MFVRRNSGRLSGLCAMGTDRSMKRIASRDTTGVIDAATQALWSPSGIYTNTASYGLPPRPAWDALQTALGDWHGGGTSWEHWGDAAESARGSFARLIGVPAERVAIGATVSDLLSTAVTALPAGARVVVPDVE